MNKVQLNSKELKETLTHLITNNRAIQEDGLKPVAISICGAAGLGKTSVVEQLAEELNIKHVEILFRKQEPSKMREKKTKVLMRKIRQTCVCTMLLKSRTRLLQLYC